MVTIKFPSFNNQASFRETFNQATFKEALNSLTKASSLSISEPRKKMITKVALGAIGTFAAAAIAYYSYPYLSSLNFRSIHELPILPHSREAVALTTMEGAGVGVNAFMDYCKVNPGTVAQMENFSKNPFFNVTVTEKSIVLNPSPKEADLVPSTDSKVQADPVPSTDSKVQADEQTTTLYKKFEATSLKITDSLGFWNVLGLFSGAGILLGGRFIYNRLSKEDASAPSFEGSSTPLTTVEQRTEQDIEEQKTEQGIKISEKEKELDTLSKEEILQTDHLETRKNSNSNLPSLVKSKNDEGSSILKSPEKVQHGDGHKKKKNSPVKSSIKPIAGQNAGPSIGAPPPAPPPPSLAFPSGTLSLAQNISQIPPQQEPDSRPELSEEQKHILNEENKNKTKWETRAKAFQELEQNGSKNAASFFKSYPTEELRILFTLLQPTSVMPGNVLTVPQQEQVVPVMPDNVNKDKWDFYFDRRNSWRNSFRTANRCITILNDKITNRQKKPGDTLYEKDPVFVAKPFNPNQKGKGKETQPFQLKAPAVEFGDEMRKATEKQRKKMEAAQKALLEINE